MIFSCLVCCHDNTMEKLQYILEYFSDDGRGDWLTLKPSFQSSWAATRPECWEERRLER